jgi:hypothetical protein
MNDESEDSSAADKARGTSIFMLGSSLSRALRRKFFALLTVTALVALVVVLIRHYFYILDAY